MDFIHIEPENVYPPIRLCSSMWFPHAAACGGHWLVLIFHTSGYKHVKEDTAVCDSISYIFVIELKK